MAIARRKARIVALQALYEADATGHPAAETIDRLVAAEGLSAATARFAQELANGVIEHRMEIDRIIENAAPLRPLEDLSAIDRNVLRLAINELLFDNKAPVAAVINEAVELARRFGTDNSSRFINGVLGAVSATAAQ